MSNKQTIATNTSIVLLSNIVGRFLAFIYIIITAKYLGVSNFGVLSFALAFAQIFGIFTDFGLDYVTIREVARDKGLSKKYFNSIMFLKIILCIATSAVIVGIIGLLKYSPETKIIIYILSLSFFLKSFSKIYDSIFQSHERMIFSSTGFILSQLVILIGVIIAVSNHFGLFGFASLYVTSNFLVLIYDHIALRSFFFKNKASRPKAIINIDLTFLKKTFKDATPFFLSGFLTIAAFRIDTIMLSFMKGNSAVGNYSAAYKILEVFLFVPMAVGTASYPSLSKYFINSKGLLAKAYTKLFKYLFAISIPIAVILSLQAKSIILLVFNDSFLPSVDALRILIWAVPILFFTATYGILLAAINKQKVALNINLSCLILNVICNFLLIPRYGINGAALATLVTTGLSLVLCFTYISRHFYKLPFSNYKQFSLKLLIANTALVIFAMTAGQINIIVIMIFCIIIYFACLLFLRFFTDEDIDLLCKMCPSGTIVHFLKSIVFLINSAVSKLQNNYLVNNARECKKNRAMLLQARKALANTTNVKEKPLVSVRIATYNRGEILTNRTIPSILAQTYQNFEIIVVGDQCTDNTGELIERINDKRIKFINLPHKGQYPSDQFTRWMVAGVTPMNKAVEVALGDWIAPLDDDDEFSNDHIEKLLNFATGSGLEMVYGKVLNEKPSGKWVELGSWPLRHGGISHLSVLYRANLKFMQYDINSWRYYEPADWNLWRRMKEAGVKIGFLDEVVGKHFLEGTQRKESS